MNHPPQPPPPGAPHPGSEGPGPGYGGYNGYPPPSMGDNPMQRTFQDYLLILRERKWYIIVTFLLIFSSVLVYTLSQTKIYRSAALIQILRSDPQVTQFQAVTDNNIRSLEDLNTLVKVLESGSIIQRVAERLSGEELAQFMAPYIRGGSRDPITSSEVLAKNRKIVQQRVSLVILVQYHHPDRHLAAKVANMFVDEFIAYNTRVRIGESMKAVEEQKVLVEQQRKKVEQLAVELQNYRESHKMVSLDKGKDIVTERLKQLNAYVTKAGADLKNAEVRWQQVRERREAGQDLTDLSFIADQPIITQLLQQRAERKIEVAKVEKRYRAKHPTMINAMQSLEQVETELVRAVASAAASIEGEYQTALRNEKQARASLEEQESQTMNLGRASVDYLEKQRTADIEEALLQNITARMKETSTSAMVQTQNARVIDQAVASQPEDYVKPTMVLNIGLGLIGGLGCGFALAFFVAFIDDRVKSSFDIESVVGLPLIGVIPEVRKMASADKAQLVATHADRQVSEAFLSLHSSLRLKDESKNAQCILVTSTIPGEGKSFTTTNLALTFAAHGERVVVVDCDLRRPNVHKSFRLENKRGVIDACGGTMTLDEVTIKNVHPNLDVIPAGGRAKSPTQVLNSQGFEAMIADLRKRYDRIFLDTPPIAAVSDALIILPLVDGSIFTVFFNKVRRKAAQYAARRLLDAHVPNFGAVLNGLTHAVSGYYYAQYYDKAYKDYYVVMSKRDDSALR